MMPKMDGVEATKILRQMGYDRPIVALTANAVAGQAEIFLGNSFDDFISKPIDIRQLNAVLNRLVRGKQSDEVIKEARIRAITQSLCAAEAQSISRNAGPPRLTEEFVRDANKSIVVLDWLIKKGGPYSEEEIRTFVIHTHGVKSALANIGRMDLSAIALKLEQLGRGGNTEAIIAETPEFLDSLRECVEKLKQREEKPAMETTDEDRPYLKEKLLAVKTACQAYDDKTVEQVLTQLRLKVWPRETEDFLETISEKLLHSDFDEITDVITSFLDGK
jgi:HPt (histidine-containing phosphotransfer) domain-containing protein